MKYEVTFAMCHCESTIVNLDEEDIQDLSDYEIENLVEEIARRQICNECPMYEVDDLIAIQAEEE